MALLASSLAAGDTVEVLPSGAEPVSAGAWRVSDGHRLVRPRTRSIMHEVVVVLDDRTMPEGPWLGPLVGALGEPSVTAAAPRSNIADGDALLVGIPYRAHEDALRRAFVQALAEHRSAQVTDAEVLSGPCIAVRRDLFLAAGGVRLLGRADPVATLAGIAKGRGRLVVADGSYLHHGGGPPARLPRAAVGAPPFVSACLIVRDERDALPRCLASLEGFCDEVVVYDTGSGDDTREVARGGGAVVVEGFWDDDFSRARNAALEYCRGQWVLWIDADEELVCDPAAQRQELAGASADVDGYIVMIDNVRGTKASTTMAQPGFRIFRRAVARWEGRLHEQVVARTGTQQLGVARAAGTRLTHWGYLTSDFASRDKGRRNLKSAFTDLVSQSGVPWPARLVNLGRSYGLCERNEEAVEMCRAAIDAGAEGVTKRLALRTIIAALLALGRTDEAFAAIEELRSLTDVQTLADIDAATALLMVGRAEEALAALGRVTEGSDDDGFEYETSDISAHEATALSRLGRHADAASVLLSTLRASGGMDVHIGTLVSSMDEAGMPLAELARAVPPGREVAFLGQLLQLEPETADRVLEAWHQAAPSKAVLATATRVAKGISLERRTVWSERLRDVGLPGACPLIAFAAGSCTAVEGLLGAASALDRHDDPRGHMALVALTRLVPGPTAARVKRALSASAPSAVEIFEELVSLDGAPAPPSVKGGVTSGGRSVLVATPRAVSIRTMAVALSLQRGGHDVTLLQPQPIAGTSEQLSRAGVEVVPAGAGGVLACAAVLSAQRRFDAVVLDRRLHDSLTRFRRLAPSAHALVDLDDTMARRRRPGDIFLSMAQSDDAQSVVYPASAPHLFLLRPSVPEAMRRGICVVGDFEDATGDELEVIATSAPSWAGARGTGPVPIAILGDGAEEHVAPVLPAALVVAPPADPTPWLGAARAVLVVTRAGALHWLAAAAMCGTPALAVPGAPHGPDGVAQLAAALGALADPDASELWARFAPPPPASAPPPLPDPLPSRLPPARRCPGKRRRPSVAIAGGELAAGEGFAGELSRELGASGIDLVDDPSGATVEVRSGGLPDLSVPAGARLVAGLRWGLGALPTELVGPIRDVADEVWAQTHRARTEALASGVSPAKVHVVPAGVDTGVFCPDGPIFDVATDKSTKLLFVGDCSAQSGVDALLEAYLTGFTADDDVCLVVSPTAADGPLLADVRCATETAERARVVLTPVGLPPLERAALFRACDLVVRPDRAQSDLRTVLEAMACARPVVVAGGGAFGETCGTGPAYLVTAHEVEIGPEEAGVIAASGPMRYLEPSRASLASLLQRAVKDASERHAKGEAARRRASRFTIQRSASVAARRLERLCACELETSPARAPTAHRGAHA